MCKKYFFISLVSAFLLPSCENEINVRGTYVPGEVLNKLAVGKDTVTDVVKKIGSPTLILSQNEWIYICKKQKITPLLKDETVVEKNFKVTFDEKGILSKMEMVKLCADENINYSWRSTNVNQRIELPQSTKSEFTK